MLSRRQVVLAFGAGVIVSPHSNGQQKTNAVPRIGVLLSTSSVRLEPLRRGLRELGYVEGKNISLEFRAAEGNIDRLPVLATELVNLGVAVIVTAGSTAIRAARGATTTIPIVFAGTGDPVSNGFVASLAKPGGNTTGLSMMTTETSAKHLEFLREYLPKLSKVALLGNTNSSTHDAILEKVRFTSQRMGIAVVPFDVHNSDDVERSISAMKMQAIRAMIVASDAFLFSAGRQIAELALKYRLPAISPFMNFAEFGGLMSHGNDLADLWRRSAAYVDKILKGANPADLPVEQPTKFELVINLKTANEIGIKIPQSLLLRADKVIE